MSSLLDKYKKAVTEDRGHPRVETLEGQPYKAYGTAAASQRRLDLRPGYDAQRMISYFAITDIMYAGDFMLTLRCGPGFVVEIKGQNLEEMIGLIREERLTFIQEHIPEWHLPVAENDALVQVLEITDSSLSKRAPKPGKH